MRLAAGDHNSGCAKHAALRPPKIDPWPMPPAERRGAEGSYWPRLARRYNVPPRYRDLRLEELMATPATATPAVQAMSEFLEEGEPRCLTLAGPPGVTKTATMVAGFREEACWACEPDCAVWYSMPALARALLDPDTSRAAVDACIKADLLALDDVGLAYTKAGGWVESAFEEILVEREANYSLTLMTTNLPLTAFEAHVGDRVADRLRGPWGEWVALPGQSLRRKRRGTGA